MNTLALRTSNEYLAIPKNSVSQPTAIFSPVIVLFICGHSYCVIKLTVKVIPTNDRGNKLTRVH